MATDSPTFSAARSTKAWNGVAMASVMIAPTVNGTFSGRRIRFFAGIATYSASAPSAWMPMSLLVRQISVCPVMQFRHEPQKSTGSTVTRSPSSHPSTLAPVRATSPEGSWPRVIGVNAVGVTPSKTMWRSDPQSPTALVRIRTSSSSTSGTGTFSIRSGSFTSWNRAAFISDGKVVISDLLDRMPAYSPASLSLSPGQPATGVPLLVLLASSHGGYANLPNLLWNPSPQPIVLFLPTVLLST